ncbi:MAG: 2,5-didehydrogluconate reductase [Cyanobacteria bacterium RYN_339]|nr:2,5-didehydrogluconate reductase [Cyanobacteria bacterium RYN_339]
MSLSIASRATLNDGHEMPWFGLGVWQASARETVYAVGAALKEGYRLVDTAKLYGNEAEVGQAVRDSGIPRDEVFVTSKLWNNDHGSANALRAGVASQQQLGLGPIDLYLIHYPVPRLRLESWRALIQLRERGVARSIGVSNFTVRHLQELIKDSGVVPAVNQVEFHPFLFQRELLEYCQAQGIVLQAYCPLTQGQRLDHPVVVQVGTKYARTPAQVLIRWGLQHGVSEIPKSVKAHRLAENAQVFDWAIAPEDMALLDNLNEDLHTSWDPSREP